MNKSKIKKEGKKVIKLESEALAKLSNSLNNNRMPGIPNSTHYFNLDFKLNNKFNLLLNCKLTGDMYADNFNNSKIIIT